MRKHSQTNKCQGSLYLHAGIPSSLPQFNVQPLKANMHCILPGVLHPTLSFRGRASRWHGSRCVTDGAGCDATCGWQSNTSDNLRKISCCDCCRGAYISGAVATGRGICVSPCQAPISTHPMPAVYRGVSKRCYRQVDNIQALPGCVLFHGSMCKLKPLRSHCMQASLA